MQKVNEKLRKLRETHKYSQEQMAEFLQIAQSTYSRMEAGETKINLEMIDKISAACDMDIVDLIYFLTEDQKYAIHHAGNNEITNDSNGNSGYNYAENITINQYAGMNKEEKELYEKQIMLLNRQIELLEKEIELLKLK